MSEALIKQNHDRIQALAEEIRRLAGAEMVVFSCVCDKVIWNCASMPAQYQHRSSEVMAAVFTLAARKEIHERPLHRTVTPMREDN